MHENTTDTKQTKKKKKKRVYNFKLQISSYREANLKKYTIQVAKRVAHLPNKKIVDILFSIHSHSVIALSDLHEKHVFDVWKTETKFTKAWYAH